MRIDVLASLVRSYYDSEDPSHDWAHVCRVASVAQSLAQDEGAEKEIVLAAVYCHDLINLPKDHPERKLASTKSAKEAAPLLRKSEFSENEIIVIQKAIVEHSFSRGMTPSTLESSIVQDADRLDALGAIGVLRCASVNTHMKCLFYDAEDPFAEKRELDDKRFMLDHYFVKLFKLPELMNTKAARMEAERRVEFMKIFLKQLQKEMVVPGPHGEATPLFRS